MKAGAAGAEMGAVNQAAGQAAIRLQGLDLARFIAFTGMVLVNFFMVMSSEEPGDGLGAWFISVISGRAAASFVVLAGIGFGLSALAKPGRPLTILTVKRSAFLLVAGLANSLIFDADILHYYAFYFLIGIMFVGASDAWLKTAIAFLILSFLTLIFLVDYDAGWDWDNYIYVDFWEPAGFLRNLFFNGWHPLIPWAAFFLYGMFLARKPLSSPRFQMRLMLGGIGALIGAESLSAVLLALAGEDVETLGPLFGTSPAPPVPLYMMAGLGAASLVTGLSLRLAPRMARLGVLEIFARPGRQTLSLYIAHIFIGMTVIETIGLLGEQTGETAVAASLVFCLLAIFYAKAWARISTRGPIEWLMRKLTG